MRLLLAFFISLISTNVYAYDLTADANCQAAYAMTSSGSETDLSGNSATLTESASDDIPTTTDAPFKNSANSRDFETTETEYLETADGGSTDISGADQTISYCAWVKWEDSVTGAVIAKYDSGSSNDRSYLMDSECVVSGDGANTADATADTAQSTGVWYHQCCVYNDTDLRFYIDGVVQSDVHVFSDGLKDNADPLFIGARKASNSPTAYMDGLITGVIILDRALSADEVYDLYLQGIDGTDVYRRTF